MGVCEQVRRPPKVIRGVLELVDVDAYSPLLSATPTFE
jgi:hypothetical protein